MLMLKELMRCNEACFVSVPKQRDWVPLSDGNLITSDAFRRKGLALLWRGKEGIGSHPSKALTKAVWEANTQADGIWEVPLHHRYLNARSGCRCLPRGVSICSLACPKMKHLACLEMKHLQPGQAGAVSGGTRVCQAAGKAKGHR